ncbi:hypothetical protein LTR53_008095 [Teratosphaeriaceae sp. CCFEE 6253]|nr:hypothetical protein LTR53_008095 [Teratosphaeriaceae sp. CCFEE 6253]
MVSTNSRVTIRDLGYTPGVLKAGLTNSILDVAGVHISQTTTATLGASVKNATAAKGLTIISPRPPKDFYKPCHAGTFTFNGNGELTGSRQIADWGFTNTPIAFTNSLSLGTVFDGMWDWIIDRQAEMEWDDLTRGRNYGTPVVGETADWLINSDVRHSRLDRADIKAAFDGLKSAADGASVEEGQRGGGAGMTCHMFAGGTGTSSRLLGAGEGSAKEYTLGVLCQSNYGGLTDMIIGGVPIGKILQKEKDSQASAAAKQGEDGTDFHIPTRPAAAAGRTEDGSILILIITDAPLAPHQLACGEAVEEAVLNSMVGGRDGVITMTGDSIAGLPMDRVKKLLAQYPVKI